MNKKKFKKTWKKIWWFIWEDNSIWSWIVNIILAFLIIKFLFYPGLGLIVGTQHPIVAVVSSSMEHNETFDKWWPYQNQWYSKMDISKERFETFPFKNGFNKGDIIFLIGSNPKDIRIGNIIVFQSAKPDPIIHRVVAKWQYNEKYYFQTKGDNRLTNQESIRSTQIDETNISENTVIGKALFRVPWLGYVKIWFV